MELLDQCIVTRGMYVESILFLYTACQCSLLGVVDDGDCVKVADGMREPGDCYCKANVMGKQCNMCMPGYYNLSAQNPDGCQGIVLANDVSIPPTNFSFSQVGINALIFLFSM